MVAEDKVLCMRVGKDEKMKAMEKIASLGPSVSALFESDPSVKAIMEPGGLLSLMMDPALRATLPATSQDGIDALMAVFSAPGTMYAGHPLRVNGRTIGTFCALYTPREDEYSEAEHAELLSCASEVAHLVDQLADVTEAGSPMIKRPAPITETA